MTNAKKTNIKEFKVIPIRTENFGGYVAKNWRCLLLLSPWCHYCLSNEQMLNVNQGLLPDPKTCIFSQ